jgi:membrane-bound metal-dependent hydrolase YbcI (DUF457 family)
MALPVGHSLVGLAIARKTNIHPIFAVILANLPDIDFSFGLILGGGALAYHRGITHTPGFAAVIASMYFVYGKLFRVKNLEQKTFGVFMIVLSHVIIDFDPLAEYMPYKFDVTLPEYNFYNFFSSFIANIDFIYNNIIDMFVYGPIYVIIMKFILKSPLNPFISTAATRHQKK